MLKEGRTAVTYRCTILDLCVTLLLGFAELDRLREVSKNDALTKPLNDDYVPKLEHTLCPSHNQ
jgi:hypothetical protein